MPSSSEQLRQKFMKGNDDGILKCRDIICKAGGTITNGMIVLPLEDNDEVLEAVQFLIEEWDYAIG